MKKFKYIFSLIAVLGFGLVSTTSCDLLSFLSSNSNSTTENSQPSSNTGSSSSTSSTGSSSSSSSSSSSIITGKQGTKLEIKKQSGYFTIPNSNIELSESGYYTKKEEVAAYIIAFKKLPDNYFSANQRDVCRSQLGDKCMLYGSTSFGNREGLLDPSLKYREADLYYGDKGFTGNRGAIRLVFTVGNADYTKDAVFYSEDHYADYSEYLNYYSGFGKVWRNSFSNYPEQTVGNYVVIDNGIKGDGVAYQIGVGFKYEVSEDLLESMGYAYYSMRKTYLI